MVSLFHRRSNMPIASRPLSSDVSVPGVGDLCSVIVHRVAGDAFIVACPPSLGRIIIVFDALGECGTRETRRGLLHTLFASHS